MAEPDSSTNESADAPGAPAAVNDDGPVLSPADRPAPAELAKPPSDDVASMGPAELSFGAKPASRSSRPSSAKHPTARSSVSGPAHGVDATDPIVPTSPKSAPPSSRSPASDARPLAAYELLARSARLGDLASLTSRIVTDAARARAADWVFTSKVSASAEEMKLSREDADTRFGNALDVLGSGGEGEAERALASALWAHAVAESPRSRTEDEDRLAGDILWLATHTAFDATPLLDRALGEDAADLWTAIAARVRRIERGRGGALGRGEAVVGCAALAASGGDRTRALCAELSRDLKDPVLLRVLATGEHSTSDEVRFEGELLPAPRGPVATTLLAVTGVLFVVHGVRIIGRLALAYRRPAEVSFSEGGVRVKTRTELLGRTLQEREHVILRSGLVRVVREVRFPRAAFYAGFLALAVGSYVGVRAFVDGVRAASPSLLLVGLVIIALGVGADFVLGSLLPGSRGRCRITFVPRSGPVVCIGDVDARRADDALSRSLARR